MRFPSYFVATAILFAACGTHPALADAGKEDSGGKGPEQVVIKSAIDTEKVAKPAYLPHRLHQWLDCDGCHHGKGPDKKKSAYVAGQKIEPCEACHNSKAGMPERIATLKRAGHTLCMECHLQQDKELAKCGVCHNKK
ncbi:MAG: cytochrome c family protein [Desulfobulbus sp.]|jgi:predicted CXXCH cytochrome family protein|uniref:cytochrome c3 family protein n=1 Tax=Desulfobulbus sp. TaxID=895 RepID=UPI00283EE770|nr:cytochrome c3 family protein [Desulfobulbus sp.]MDR2550995.1 cytochrome c family protein [Desulfobulbus sp.]